MIFISGCAGTAGVVANKDNLQHIKKLTVSQAQENPFVPTIIQTQMNNPSVGFLLGAVLADRASIRSHEYGKIFDTNENPIAGTFNKAIERNLEDLDYVLIPVPKKAEFEKNSIFAINEQKNLKSHLQSLNENLGQDASMLINFGASFNSTTEFSDYMPFAFASIEVTDSKSLKIIYKKTYAIGHIPYRSSNVAKECRFKNQDDLQQRVVQARKCMNDTVIELANSITKDFARNQ